MTDREQIFDRVKQSAAFAARASRTLPDTTGAYVGDGCIIVILSAACLVGLTITVGLIGLGIYISRKEGEALPGLACGAMAILPALMTVAIIAILTSITRRISQFSNAPTHAVPAVVVSKHSRGFGQGVTNYILLEFEGGQRQEYRIGYEEEAALVGVGDAGVAFTRLDVFLAFDRVP